VLIIWTERREIETQVRKGRKEGMFMLFTFQCINQCISVLVSVPVYQCISVLVSLSVYQRISLCTSVPAYQRIS
jgi:hypothetical protein